MRTIMTINTVCKLSWTFTAVYSEAYCHSFESLVSRLACCTFYALHIQKYLDLCDSTHYMDSTIIPLLPRSPLGPLEPYQ